MTESEFAAQIAQLTTAQFEELVRLMVAEGLLPSPGVQPSAGVSLQALP